MPVAMGDCVGAEWGGSRVGLCQSALPVGACHTPSLPKICVLLEASQASRPASQQSECSSALGCNRTNCSERVAAESKSLKQSKKMICYFYRVSPSYFYLLLWEPLKKRVWQHFQI